jgi:5,10-methylenetetrahydromethanopterin reductase
MSLEVGLTIWLDRNVAEAAELAIAAEAAGFADVWLPDHYFLRDAFAALALMAGRTRSLRLGTAVVSPLLRHPALLASATATIDELSGGRAVLGIGPGGYEFGGQLGLPIPRPLAVTREAVEVVRRLLRGEASFEGTAFRVSGARLGWEARDVPLYLAARGPRMLELAGEIADGVITHGLAPSHVEYVVAGVRRGAERAGRDPSACEICLMFDVELDEDERAAIDRLRPRCVIMAGGSYSEEMIPVYGLDPAAVRPLREAVSAGEMARAARLVTDEMVRAFAVAGPAEALAERLSELSKGGVGRVILNVGAGASLEEAIARVGRAGRAVAGRVN